MKRKLVKGEFEMNEMEEKTSEIPEGWNYPGFDQKGKVICQICGKSYMILTPSHLNTHDNMNYAKYKNEFPDAPITNEEFKAISMYSQPSKYSEEDLKILGEETVIDEDAPVIDDDFELPQIKAAKQFSNPIDAKKHSILEVLLKYLPDVRMDYKIEIIDGSGMHVYSAISDYADPFLKVNVEFPKTFWHNRDAVFDDPNRNIKLEKYGWKVISIDSNSPSIEKIESILRQHM